MSTTIDTRGEAIKYTPFGQLQAGDLFIRVAGMPVLIRDLPGTLLNGRYRAWTFGNDRWYDVHRMEYKENTHSLHEVNLAPPPDPQPCPLTEQDLEDMAAGRAFRQMHSGTGMAHMAALILIREACKVGANQTEITEEGVRMNGDLVGTWHIQAKQVA